MRLTLLLLLILLLPLAEARHASERQSVLNMIDTLRPVRPSPEYFEAAQRMAMSDANYFFDKKSCASLERFDKSLLFLGEEAGYTIKYTNRSIRQYKQLLFYIKASYIRLGC